VSIYLANGQGGFGPPKTYPTGPDPTGLTVADVNGDGIPDLLVGNSYGDVLVLLGDGLGGFVPYHKVDEQVALAVAGLGAKGQDVFAFSNKGLNQVAVQAGPDAGPQVVGSFAQGILDPGAVVLADLNGDGIPDLIVANSGANDVLVYPGLGGARYGPAQTFPAGTDPVGITVADVNADGIPDLVVANHGSNDVSILLGQGQGANWTLTPLERLKTGAGPTATVVQEVNGVPNLFVSDSSASEVRRLQGVGDGFFDDAHYTTYATGADPGPLFVGNFTGNPGQLDLVTVNAGSNDLSFISDINGGNLVAQSIPSGGEQPVAAVAGSFGGSDGGEDLLVANNGDGHLALFLSGEDGLSLSQILEEPGLANPTALAMDESGDLFGNNEGIDAAIPIILGLGGVSGGGAIGPGVLSMPQEEPTGVSLQPLNSTSPSLGVIATLLSVMVVMPGEREVVASPSAQSLSSNETAGEEGGASAPPSLFQAPVVVGASSGVTSGVPRTEPSGDEAGGEPEETEVPEAPAAPRPAATAVVQFVAGLDASLASVRREALRGAFWSALREGEGGDSASRMMAGRLARWSPLLVAVGVPALTLTVELVQAALTPTDQSAAASAPAGAEAGRSEESTESAAAPNDWDGTPMACRSLLDLVAAELGLAAVARVHSRDRKEARQNNLPNFCGAGPMPGLCKIRSASNGSQ
jgi:hypothetical protein